MEGFTNGTHITHRHRQAGVDTETSKVVSNMHTSNTGYKITNIKT